MGNIFGKKVEESSTITEEPIATITEETTSTEQNSLIEETLSTEGTEINEEKDANINSEFGITLLFLCAITEGNPGAHTVMYQLMTAGYEPEFLYEFYKKLIDNKITGSRLWYIYKNECFKDIDELISKDLTPFTDSYFYEKFD